MQIEISDDEIRSIRLGLQSRRLALYRRIHRLDTHERLIGPISEKAMQSKQQLISEIPAIEQLLDRII